MNKTPPLFEREERYVVFRYKDLTNGQILAMQRLDLQPVVEGVFIEKDWPEYEKVWQMLEERVSGIKPLLDTHKGALAVDYVTLTDKPADPACKVYGNVDEDVAAFRAYLAELEKFGLEPSVPGAFYHGWHRRSAHAESAPAQTDCPLGYGHGGSWCGPHTNCWLDPRSKEERALAAQGDGA